MAIGRISIKTGSKGKGASHAKYILRQDKYKTHSSKSEKLEHTDWGNMPKWATDNPSFFWQMADEHERKNGSVYREHILTLPRELDESQRLELVKEWISQEVGDKHPYTVAIHNPLALDGKEQPHAHLMICERTLDGIERGADTFFKRYNAKDPKRGGAKKANTGLDRDTRKQLLKEQRSRWGDLVNKHLEKANSKSRVDMRNWQEKGLPEKPQNISMQDMNDTHKRIFADGTIKRLDDPKAIGGQTVKDLYKQKLLAKRELEKSLANYDRLPVDNDYTPPKKVTFSKPTPIEIDYDLWGIPDPDKAPATVAPVIDKLASDKDMLSKIHAEVKRGMIDKGMIDIINKSKYKTVIDVEIFYRDKLSDILSRTGELDENDFDELRTALTALNYIDEIKHSGLLERKRLQSLPPKPVEPPPPEPEPRHTVTPTAPAQVQTVERPRPEPEMRWTARELQAIEQSKKVLLEQINKIPDPARKAVALDKLDKSVASLTPEKVKTLVDNLDKLEKDKPTPPPPPPPEPPKPEPKPEQKGKGYGDE